MYSLYMEPVIDQNKSYILLNCSCQIFEVFALWIGKVNAPLQVVEANRHVHRYNCIG